MYTLVGPSGAGKTSLLRLLNRLDEKTAGEIYFNKKIIEDYAPTDLRRRIALVFQIPYMFDGTVASNLAFCCDDGHSADSEFAAKYLTMVGLPVDFAGKDPKKLSVGQQQRVALARALVQEPEILLLDEPTSALDPSSAAVIEDLVRRLNREYNLTIIMVTHNLSQAVAMDGVSLFMVDGRLVESGPTSEIFTNPNQALLRNFVNGSRT